MGMANSSQGLAPHTPRRRLSRLLFLCPGSVTCRTVVFSHKKRAVLPTTPSSEHPATPSFLLWLLDQKLGEGVLFSRQPLWINAHPSTDRARSLIRYNSTSRARLGVCQICESCHDHDRDDHCAAKESDVW